MNTLDSAIRYLILGSIICLAVMIFFCLIRSIKGPRITDRIVAINMIGTMVIIIICMLAIYLKESYLVDVSLIYAMISFLAVIVLCKVFTGVYIEQQKKKQRVETEITPLEECNLWFVSLSICVESNAFSCISRYISNSIIFNWFDVLKR